MPTTWPRSLMAVAALDESSPNGRSSWVRSRFKSQRTARNCRSCTFSWQDSSSTRFSAQPTTCRQLLAPVAKPLSPPRVGSGRTPSAFPDEANTLEPGVVGRGKEDPAAPLGAGTLQLIGLGHPDDETDVVLTPPGRGPAVERRRGHPARAPTAVSVFGPCPGRPSAAAGRASRRPLQGTDRHWRTRIGAGCYHDLSGCEQRLGERVTHRRRRRRAGGRLAE